MAALARRDEQQPLAHPGLRVRPVHRRQMPVSDFESVSRFPRDSCCFSGRVQLVERPVTAEECGCAISELKTGGRGLRVYRNGEALGFWEEECQNLRPGDIVVEIVPTIEGEDKGDGSGNGRAKQQEARNA